MNVALAVFVKTPGLTPLKTRLASTIGEENAHTFYKLSLAAIVETLQSTKYITPYWAVGETEGLENCLWKDFPTIHTGEGDLGDRQQHVYETLLEKHDAVILIGADAPQLSTEIVEEAIEALKSNQYVIGPATDGGYYLFAGRSKVFEKIWKETPWSHEDTREILLSKLDSTAYALKELTDVDTEADLKTVMKQMTKQCNLAQASLMQWIEK